LGFRRKLKKAFSALEPRYSHPKGIFLEQLQLEDRFSRLKKPKKSTISVLSYRLHNGSQVNVRGNEKTLKKGGGRNLLFIHVHFQMGLTNLKNLGGIRNEE